MAVNTSVYGAVDTWANAYYQQAQLTDKNKIANFGNNTFTLADGVSKGKLSYTEGIDKSLSFCGLGTECALSHIGFIARTSNNTAEIISKNERYQTNFGFFEMINNDLRMVADFRTNELYNFAWGNHSNFSNYNKKLRPLTKVNPHNFIFVIRVKAFKSNYSEYVDVDLKTYLSTHKTNYPKICCAYLVPYFGNADIGRLTEAGQGSPDQRIPLLIGLLDEYQFESKNLNFYSYEAMNLNSGMYSVVFGSFITRPYIYNISESFNMIAYTEACENYINIDFQNDAYYTSITYFDGIEDEIIKTVACFGVYFTTNETIAARGALTNNDMYIGLLDENGIGHGEYLRGADTVNAPQNEYSDMSQSGYDHTKEVDKSKYSNGTSFNLWDFSLNCVNKFYVLTSAQVEQLSTELYTIMSSVSSDMPIERYNQTVFLTQNPIDCIVSIKRFPVDVPHLGTTTTVKLGSQSTSISAHYISKPCNVYYFTFSNSSDTGLYQINGGSFLDYEPYTKVSINVPFCGSFDVPCNYFHRYGGVTVALLIDFVTGACTAFLMVNNNVVDSIQGECGVNVPLSGLQTATIDSQIFNAAMSKQKQDNNFALSMLGGAAAIGLGIATGGAAAVLGGAAAMVGGVLNKDINDKSIDYELNHMQAPIKQVSSASPVIGRANDMRCKMIISRPEYVDGYNETVYANTIGFACLINGVVSDFTGLTIGDINVDGISATAEEKEMIKRKFATGVYL